MDRSFDLIAPLQHEFNYETLVYEYHDIKDDGEFQVNKEKKIINDLDELWVKFRNTHIAEVHVTLNLEVSKLA